jgi:outer membrane protein insertion porin family/translocation and assembly module TamA
LVCVLLVLLVSSCASIPGRRYALDKISFTGNTVVDDEDLKEKLASRETTRFLGVFQGFIYDYEVFDRYVLERDLERVERVYRARGYYRARARVGRVFYSDRHTKVEIVVDEGPPVYVARLDVHGTEKVPQLAGVAARAVITGRVGRGAVFDEDEFHAAQEDAKRVLGNFGYAYANVVVSAQVDLPKNVASLGFWLEPGKRARLGRVRIEGLGDLPSGPVERALDLKPGSVFSQDELDEAKQAVLDLGVFSSVVVEPDVPPQQGEIDPDSMPEVVPIRVRVEVSKLRSLRLGGGVALDSTRADVHLTAGWEHRNFFGGFRTFQVEVVPGLVFYPTHLPNLAAPQRLLPQGRLRTELRQPGFIEARTNGVLRAQASVYPLLFSNDTKADSPVLGYRELRGSAGVERSMRKVSAGLSHNLQQNTPFAYAGTLDPDLTSVLVSYPELFAELSIVDDRISPHEGFTLRTTLQVAGLGGDARDVKVQPDARVYLPVAKKTTLALRATTGFLFPANYGQTVEPNALTRGAGGVSRREWVQDSQLMFLRGYFAGGPGSNRGYGPREIGPHGIVPFYNPGLTASELGEDCVGTSVIPSSDCALPLGGFTLWEASVELRYPIMGPLSGAVFLDAADVSLRKVHLRLNRPHLSGGLGLRYDTPIGPVRFDAGYRIPGLQAPASPDEGVPDKTFGLPIALSFGIGEAF